MQNGSRFDPLGQTGVEMRHHVPYVLAKFVTHIIRDVVADHRRLRVAPSRPKLRAAIQLGTAILCAEDFTSVSFR